MLRLGWLVFLMPLVWSATLPDDAENEISFSLDPADEDNDNECLMDNRTMGICVPYYQCYGNKTLIEDGSTLIDFRSGSACRHFLERCCHRSTSDAPSGSVLKPKNVETSLDDKFSSGNIPSAEINTQASAKSPLPDETILNSADIVAECGWNNPDIRIFSKTNNARIYADYGEFRWMVALIGKSSQEYLGGGSIIHPSVVLTVAHKVDLLTATEIKCRGGEWDTQSTMEQYPFQDRNVEKILLHPHFYKISLYYDAALLILESPFDLGKAPHMGTACLSSVPSTPEKECFTMGWGKDFIESDKYALILKKTKLPIVGSATCEKLLQNTRLGSFFRLHKSLTCAGGEKGIDACKGDGGSSLVCKIKRNGDHTRYAMVGIVAYGIGCGKIDVPGVYVKVSERYPWINKVMTDEGYGNSTYII